MDCFLKYLIDDTVPDNLPESKRFKWKAIQFVLLDGRLHRKSFSLLLLKCMQPNEANYVLRKIHERIYRNHLGARSLAYKDVQKSTLLG